MVLQNTICDIDLPYPVFLYILDFHILVFTLSFHMTSTIEGPYQPKLDIGKVLRIFFYVPTPTKLTNAISKTQLSGPKKGVFSPKPPQMCPPFSFLACF